MLKEILDIIDLLDGADANGETVVQWLRQRGADAEVVPIDAGGHTDLVRVRIAGVEGRTAGGRAPTLGIIGRLGGVGSRPKRLGLVSDADGAIVALAAAGVLARMQTRGDRLRGDVLVRTHVSPASPMIPHEPAPFIDVPVDRDVLARAEMDAEMDAILSIDATRANRIAKRSGFGITGTVKEGYLLRPTPAVLDICERVGRRPAVVVPIFTQDLTPPGNGIHHINSILQPATMTDAPVIGIALLSPMIVGGASTGVVHEQDLATAGRAVVEIAKEFSAGTLAFYHEQEFRRLVDLYGPMKRFQEPPAATGRA
jgi:hypothetical protein